MIQVKPQALSVYIGTSNPLFHLPRLLHTERCLELRLTWVARVHLGMFTARGCDP